MRRDYAARSAGESADTPRGTLAGAVNTGDAARVHLADVGGDSRGDIVYFGTNAIRVRPTTGGTSDLVTAIANGIGVTATLTYKPLTDSTVYTKDTTATYPLRDIRVPIYVAASHTTSNGIGGTYQMTYFYTTP